MSLEALHELLQRSRIARFESQAAELEVEAIASIDQSLVRRLMDIATVEARSPDDTKLEIPSGAPLPTGAVLVLSDIPRNPSTFVGQNLADLISNDGFRAQEPSEWLLVSLHELNRGQSLWSCRLDDPPAEIRAYRAAQQLVHLLQRHADHYSRTKSPPRITVFDVERLDIDLVYTTHDLKVIFPADDLLRFLEAESLPLVRSEALKGTLWDFLKDFEVKDRLRRLLKGGNDFLRRLKRNFALAQREFRLDRRLEIARKELAEFTSIVSKIVLGLEAKAFAIPGAMILSARVLDLEDGLTLPNISVALGVLFIAIILTAGYFAQREIVSALKGEISDARIRLGLAQDDAQLDNKFRSLSRRISIAETVKFILMLASWMVAVIVIVMLLHEQDIL